MDGLPESAVVRRAFELWGGETRDPKLLGGTNCRVYELELGERELVLRLSAAVGEAATRLKAELDWLCYLGRHEMPVCLPVPSRQGRLLESIDEDYLAAVFERAPGYPVNYRHPEIWTPDLFETCGRTVGRLHTLAKDFVPGADARRAEWFSQEAVDLARRTLPASEHEAFRQLESFCERFAALPRGRNDFGLIHGDFHQGNYHLDEDRLVIFDFDNSSYSWFSFDIAISIQTTILDMVLHDESGLEEFVREYFTRFMGGYTQENQLDPSWIAQLGEFLQAFNLCVLASCFQRSARPDGRIFDFVSDRARRRVPCVDLDFERLYAEVLEQGAGNGGAPSEVA